jgi:alpha-methylacyl-CoA racemase
LKFWRAFCQALGRTDWADRHWQRGQVPDDADAKALREELRALLVSKPLAHWRSLLAHVDCCVTPVLRVDEAMEHPAAAPYVTAARNATGAKIKTITSPIQVLD